MGLKVIDCSLGSPDFELFLTEQTEWLSRPLLVADSSLAPELEDLRRLRLQVDSLDGTAEAVDVAGRGQISDRSKIDEHCQPVLPQACPNGGVVAGFGEVDEGTGAG